MYSQTNLLNFNILQLIISGTVSIVSGKKTTKQMVHLPINFRKLRQA